MESGQLLCRVLKANITSTPLILLFPHPARSTWDETIGVIWMYARICAVGKDV